MALDSHPTYFRRVMELKATHRLQERRLRSIMNDMVAMTLWPLVFGLIGPAIIYIVSFLSLLFAEPQMSFSTMLSVMRSNVFLLAAVVLFYFIVAAYFKFAIFDHLREEDVTDLRNLLDDKQYRSALERIKRHNPLLTWFLKRQIISAQVPSKQLVH